MNLTNSMGLSPTSFRRALTAHGRSTTPGWFDHNKSETDREKVHKVDDELADSVEPVNKGNLQDNGQNLQDNSQNLSGNHQEAVKEQEEGQARSPTDTCSFYKRPFRVLGNEAWEYAMRDLGSRDTLINRYGYVDPEKRNNK